MKPALVTLLALGMHLVVGWWATPLAALAGGAWKGRGGWWLGLVALVASWGTLVVYSFARDADSFGRMATTMGGLLGGLPGIAVVVATLFVAAVLGLLGGLAGTNLRYLLNR